MQQLQPTMLATKHRLVLVNRIIKENKNYVYSNCKNKNW